MARKLKVFRTAAGFHDAYVAAPSRKAALAAWGSDADLFARGMAEEVTDAAEMAEALAQPGVVIRRSRGSAAEQLAALPKGAAKLRRKAAVETPRAAPATPRPSREALDAAEAALTEAERRAKAIERAFAERQAALDRERRAAKREAESELGRVERARQEAAEAYDAAVKRWRE